MQENQCKTIELDSPYYPKEWVSLADAPKTLQYLGNISLLQTRKFTVVGARTTPTQSKKLGKEIVADISKIFTIVTGVADGGDEAAIEGALEGGGKVICVLAGGFSALPQGNFPLLRRVVKQGLLLSPYPFDEPTRNYTYEYRNKLLSHLGEGTLVLGAAEKSGALITAGYAKKQGKPVFALPYSVGVHAGVGCNKLIKTGAYLTESAMDIYTALGVETTATERKIALSQTEQAVVDALAKLSDCHVSELAEKSGVPIFKLRAVLSALEMKGVVASIGGNRYAPIK